jgi:hypothetical protein
VAGPGRCGDVQSLAGHHGGHGREAPGQRGRCQLRGGRSWVYALLARYRAEAEAAFEVWSRRPGTSLWAIPGVSPRHRPASRASRLSKPSRGLRTLFAATFPTPAAFLTRSIDMCSSCQGSRHPRVWSCPDSSDSSVGCSRLQFISPGCPTGRMHARPHVSGRSRRNCLLQGVPFRVRRRVRYLDP